MTLLGKCQLIEQRNVTMNQFVAGLIARMREAGIDLSAQHHVPRVAVSSERGIGVAVKS